MKWLVFDYFVFLFLFYGFVFISKKKKKDFKKVFCSVFVLFHVIFFVLFVFCYQGMGREQFFLQKEYENLGATYENIVDSKEILEYEGFQLQKEIVLLENEVTLLEENWLKVSQEVQTLQKKYSSLVLKPTNQNEINVSYENYIDYEEFQIQNFPTYDQRKYYLNGCESVSLYLLLKYNGVNVSPETIVSNLRMGETPHMEGNVKYGGDPEVEFVGNPKDKSGYGVFENQIIDVANQFKSGIKKITGTSLDGVLEIVKQGHPVQVWASSYQRTPIKCNTWIHKASGKTITWYCNFHSLVLIGSTGSKVIVSDPLTGTIVRYDRKRFEAAYNFYGRRAIYYE